MCGVGRVLEPVAHALCGFAQAPETEAGPIIAKGNAGNSEQSTFVPGPHSIYGSHAGPLMAGTYCVSGRQRSGATDSLVGCLPAQTP